MTETGAPAISFRHITKAFRTSDQEVLAMDDVSLDIRAGEFVAIIGPSGCGKTSLLRMAAGLIYPSSGDVLHNGRPVTSINTEVGFVTQESNLFPWMTLMQNVTFPLEVRSVPKEERVARARDMIETVGLTGFEKRYPHELSGGMQKRGAIVRTMIYDSDVVLMDEPFGPLDAQTRGVLQAELLRIWERTRKTIVFVTHDLVEAIALSDRVAVMSRRPGRIKEVVEIGLPRPRNPFEVQALPGFPELQTRLWALLRDEIVGSPAQDR